MNQDDYVKLSDTCRICLNHETNMIWMLGKDQRVQQLHKLLYLITNSKITYDEHLPNFVCLNCEKKLNTIYQLQVQLTRTNKILQECIQAASEEQQPNYKAYIDDSRFIFPREKEVEVTIKQKRVPKTIFEHDVVQNEPDGLDEIEAAVSKAEQLYNAQNVPCPSCNFIGKTALLLYSHIQLRHPNIFEQWCPECSARTPGNKVLHMEIVHLKCPFCKLSLPTKTRLIVHLRTHANYQYISCAECGVRFSTAKLLATHMNDAHNKNECLFCPEKFRTICELNEHNQLFHNFQCPICKMKFQTQSAALIHNCVSVPKLKTKPRGLLSNSFLCQICGLVILGKRPFRSHLTRHSNAPEPVVVQEPESVVAQKSEPFQKKEPKAKKVKGATTLQCDKCGEIIKGASRLDMHMQTHNTNVCDICNKQFQTRSKLADHLTLHTGDTPHSCNICEKKFRRKDNLYKHMQVHNNEGYCCHVCGKTLKTWSTFEVHLKNHLGFEMYKCPYYDFTNAHSIRLNIHLEKVHNEQKEYFQCEKCKITFASFIVFQKHKERKHNEHIGILLTDDIPMGEEVQVESQQNEF